MSFKHTHTITIEHANGRVERIAVDAGGRELRDLPPGSTVPLHTREETLLELPADWVFTADQGLTYFGQPEGPFKDARYTLEDARHVAGQEFGTTRITAPGQSRS
jgi:hypothetical protein